MGFDHERIHLETSSVLIRELPSFMVSLPDYWPRIHPSSQIKRDSNLKKDTSNLIQVNGGKVTLGKSLKFPSFGWDNEYGERSYEIEEFRMSENLITNG